MNATKRYILVFSIFVFFSSAVLAGAEWTFLVYAQTKNDLNAYFIQNLRDMAQVGSNERLNVIVQWEQPNRKGVWRYKVNKGKVVLDQHLATPTGNDCAADVVNFTKWAVSKYPAKHYALVLSSHGSGIIDPAYWRSSGLRGVLSDVDVKSPRGILFNWENKNYMTNQHLSKTLRMIKNNVLGRNLDVLGMDACLMSTVEMQYQVRDYANFFVASQEQEPAGGWFFSAFLRDLASRNLTPFELSSLIVGTYKQYYERRFDWYTQSAVKLEDVSSIKDNLDQIIVRLNECGKQFGKQAVKNLVRNARRSCLQLNVPLYVDLHSFYKELYKGLQNNSLKDVYFDDAYTKDEELIVVENYLDLAISLSDDFAICENEISYFKDTKYEFSPTTTNSKFEIHEDLFFEQEEFETNQTTTHNIFQDTKGNFIVESLKEDLALGMKFIEAGVVANVAGPSMSRAKGLSIYYPNDRVVDASYPKTEFAKDSLWLQFLRDYVR